MIAESHITVEYPSTQDNKNGPQRPSMARETPLPEELPWEDDIAIKTDPVEDSFPDLPPGYARIWDEEMGCYLTVKMEANGDHVQWWQSEHDADMLAYMDKYGEHLLK